MLGVALNTVSVVVVGAMKVIDVYDSGGCLRVDCVYEGVCKRMDRCANGDCRMILEGFLIKSGWGRRGQRPPRAQLI